MKKVSLIVGKGSDEDKVKNNAPGDGVYRDKVESFSQTSASLIDKLQVLIRRTSQKEKN